MIPFPSICGSWFFYGNDPRRVRFIYPQRTTTSTLPVYHWHWRLPHFRSYSSTVSESLPSTVTHHQLVSFHPFQLVSSRLFFLSTDFSESNLVSIIPYHTHVTTVVRRKIVVVNLENDFPNKQILNNHHDVEDNWSHNKTNMTIWKPNETEQRPRRQ